MFSYSGKNTGLDSKQEIIYQHNSIRHPVYFYYHFKFKLIAFTYGEVFLILQLLLLLFPVQ